VIGTPIPPENGPESEFLGRWPYPSAPLTSRIAYAAVPVIAPVEGENTPGAPTTLDWDATLAYRHRVWSYGLGVADAMDTAQRGLGLDWPTTIELIQRTAREAASVKGALVCGAGTDQLDSAAVVSAPSALRRITNAYLEHIEVVEQAGARVVLMASQALAATARDADDYLTVYSEVLAQVDRPVILHWLGEMFDPMLTCYWGSRDVSTATQTVLTLVRSHTNRIDGIKVSCSTSTTKSSFGPRYLPTFGCTPATTSTTPS